MAEQRAPDPSYAAHRWWARRPPAVFRGVLLASALPHDASDRFWEHFSAEESDVMAGLSVHDPFSGSGTTLLEAARLGAKPSGSDVDPLATELARLLLLEVDVPEFTRASEQLHAHLVSQYGELFPSAGTASPLHYFYLHLVTCPTCHQTNPLYRDPVIARDIGKPGGVRRDAEVVAFCPHCYRLHYLGKSASEVRCCSSRTKLVNGTHRAQRFHCPSCGAKTRHSDLLTGRAPTRLIAVEETTRSSYRRIRPPTESDLDAIRNAAGLLRDAEAQQDLPTAEFSEDRRDSRPRSFGIHRIVDAFTPRQLLVLGGAFRWTAGADISPTVRRALRLAISNALATNNRLCGYARDYGRLAPLFSIRSYSMPALAVELNPLHVYGGRGTLRSVFRRMIRAQSRAARRYTWDAATERPRSFQVSRPTQPPFEIRCASASDDGAYPHSPVDISVFDPPYYDYIAYSELSEFFRAWLDEPTLGGIPLLPDGPEPIKRFGEDLGAALKQIVAHTNGRYPMSFTYHSSTKPAWDALAVALDHAQLLVTALWPVRNDTHMGHHSAAGNCEWDLVLVCRPSDRCDRIAASWNVEKWLRELASLGVSPADEANLTLAVEMSRRRAGELSRNQILAGG